MKKTTLTIILMSILLTFSGCEKKSHVSVPDASAEQASAEEQKTADQQDNVSGEHDDMSDWVHFTSSFTRFDGEHRMPDKIDNDKFDELIKSGANINVRNEKGRSLLMVTTEADVMKALIDAGIDINAKDNKGMTALINLGGMRYAYDPKCIDLLIKAGSNVNEKDNNGRTALMQIPPIVIQGFQLDYNYGRSSLASVIPLTKEEREQLDTSLDWGAEHHAAFIIEYTKKLIEAGADVNAKDNRGRTPLMYAVFPEAVRYLIDAGANVNAVDNDGNTALMNAVFPEAVKMLIEAGADVNAKNKDGQTALMNAYFPDSVKLLVKAGADVKAKNKTGQTALMFAERVDTIAALIAAGADVKAKDDKGYSAFMYAYTRQFRTDRFDAADPKKIIQMFKKGGAKIRDKDNLNNSLPTLIQAVCESNPIECEKQCYDYNNYDDSSDENIEDAHFKQIDQCLERCCVNHNESEANGFTTCGNKCMQTCDGLGDCGWRCEPDCLDTCDLQYVKECTNACRKTRNGFEEIIDFELLCEDDEELSKFEEYLEKSK